jgi:short-subunit dehydrogenase
MIDTWRGKWALVTGASAGIGVELATALAAGGTNLVLTARRRERLEELATRLRSLNGVSVEIVTADLAKEDAAERIHSFAMDRRLEIELLINNAGFGVYGEFHRNSRERELDMVRVNCLAVVRLTHLFLPAMIERRSGAILILSSTAAYQAVPYITTYAATKAFDLLFAEGLAYEAGRYGVKVCALCPGSTESEFHEVAGAPARTAMAPAREVALLGLRALAEGKASVIHGFKNNAFVELQRLAPRRFVTDSAGKMFRPKELEK